MSVELSPWCAGNTPEMRSQTDLTYKPNSFFEQNTTVDDKSTAGRFDLKVFVNCVQDVQDVLDQRNYEPLQHH